MKFSQRIGKIPNEKNIQIENIDIELRNRLWNILCIYIIDEFDKDDTHHPYNFIRFSQQLWHSFYKLPIDYVSSSKYDLKKDIRDKYFKSEWYEVYDIIEFVIDYIIYENYSEERIDLFIESINEILESEFSGYRIINYKIVPISNQLEIDEVKEAIENSISFSAFKGANLHLTKSLELLSDKRNPKYRNSINESIMSVEAVCRILTDELTLGKALNKLESLGININNQLKNAFDKLYAYTNDKDIGVRHAFINPPNEPDLADAKYMLITCSAFINYLILKSSKNDILKKLIAKSN